MGDVGTRGCVGQGVRGGGDREVWGMGGMWGVVGTGDEDVDVGVDRGMWGWGVWDKG